MFISSQSCEFVFVLVISVFVFVLGFVFVILKGKIINLNFCVCDFYVCVFVRICVCDFVRENHNLKFVFVISVFVILGCA